MKKWLILMLLTVLPACQKRANDPAMKALVQLNGAVATERVDLFLKQLTPGTVKDIGTRLGLGPDVVSEDLVDRLVLAPGISAEKLRAFTPRVIRGRAGPNERWYRIDLLGQRLQVPVRRFDSRWLVALNEALIDTEGN